MTMMPKDDITKDTDVTQLADTITSDNMMNRGFFLRPKGFNTEVGSGPGTFPAGIPAQLEVAADLSVLQRG